MPEKKESWHAKSIDEMFKSLDTKRDGLSSKDAEKRLEEHGYNEFSAGEKKTPIRIFLRQFKSLLVWILILAAGISFFIGHTIEFAVILIIIILIIIINFFGEYKASRDMEALKELSPKKSVVIRDGKKKEILSRELVQGDILVLRRGDIAGADARLIECNTIKADESALTGESEPVLKKTGTFKDDAPLAQRKNMVFSGTSITDGNGLAVVVDVGEGTEMGKISAMMKGVKEEKTPLQKRLDRMTKQISVGVVFLSLIVFFTGLAHEIPLAAMLIFSMAVIVSGIPESLPTVIAITLAAGVKKMAGRNAIVKRMPAVETLGTCTTICSDKTGTITQNKMVVQNILTSDVELDVTGEGYKPEGIFLLEDDEFDPMKHKTVSKMLEIGVLCNNSEVKNEKGRWSIDGEATEGSLMVLAKKAGIDHEEYRNSYERKKEHPFDADRKCMSTVHVHKKKHFVYSKGAPEMLLKKAKYYLHAGEVKKLDRKTADFFIEQNRAYAENGLRVLGLAFKEHKGSMEIEDVESELVFAGLVSIRDPPREGVKGSVEKCRQAGMRVVMITGDNEATAKSIAGDVGIYSEGDTVMTGSQVESMDENSFKRAVNNTTVYARVSPSHKLKIVDTLQKAGNVVAMTGDGVNDAPALKKSDIGIAMGERGTEVAKESAELVLKDDNFNTIANAVEEGRTIYENIRKFISYLLVGNISEVLIVLIAVVLGVNLPLTALMILFINLVTSELPAIGLSFEKPSPKIMSEKPRDPNEGILSEYILLKIAQIVPLVVLGTIIVYTWELVVKGVPLANAQTVAFAIIVFMELFHSLNVRSWGESIFTRRFFTNAYLHGGIILSALLTLAAIYLRPLQEIFGTVPLGAAEWVIILAVSASVIFFMEIQKTIVQAEMREKQKMGLYPSRGG